MTHETKLAKELIDIAIAKIEERRAYDRTHAAHSEHAFKQYAIASCALKTVSGKIYTALNVRTYQPSIGMCGEIVAIGMAHAAEPDADIEMIVTVRGEATREYIISPCGRCREFIADYSTNATVVMPAENKRGYTLEKIKNLLPGKYTKKHDVGPGN